MIAARQEGWLRPALERLDRIVAASEGIDPGALTFAFRPLWWLDAATAATIALQKAQTTQVYAGLNLWPAATTALLVQARLAEDGTYPNAKAVFGEGANSSVGASPTLDVDPDQPRDRHGKWTEGEGAGRSDPRITPTAGPEDPESDQVKPLAPFRFEVGSSGKPHLPEFWAVDPPASAGTSAEQDPRVAQKLDNALSDYQTRGIRSIIRHSS